MRKELQLYKNKQNVYNGLIDIFNKPEFLIACYQEISQKEVGGCNKQPFTDYKINSVDREWFVNLSNSLVTGKFNFSKLVNSPLEYKIVKKALATIIEEIWESISSDNNHRPNRSEHHALKTIYLYGGYYPWVIHGYFTKDSFSNEIIMNCIKKIIKCPTMVELIQKALKAGYIEQLFGSNKSFLAEISDSFVIRNVSPLLCNIVLNEFDNYMVILKSTFTVSRLLLDKYNRNITLPRFGKYTNLDKLLYIRYGNEFVIFIETKLDTAKHIRLRIKNFIQTKGLSLNMERFVIKNTVQGFSFLGASCKRYFVKIRPYRGIESIRINNSFGLSLKTKMTRIRINIDLRKIYKKLVDSKYARFSNHSQIVPLGTAKNSNLNLSHADIIGLYNLRVIKLINFYSFAANRHKLKNIIWLLHISCALTLAKKYKIRSKSLIFKIFGRSLACPKTGVKLYIFKSLKAIHDYRPNTKVNIYFPYTKNKSNIFNSHIINNNNRDSIISSRGFLSRGKIPFSSVGLPALRARIHNIQEITPLFITGFVDAEGSFILKIWKNNKRTLGWEVQPVFAIHLNERDLDLLEEIQRFFAGIGHINHTRQGSVMYSVSNRKDLLLLINHFDSYPLITKKFYDYLLFRLAFSITSRGSLDSDKLQKLVNIRASMNKGLTPELTKAFPLTIPYNKGVTKIKYLAR